MTERIFDRRVQYDKRSRDFAVRTLVEDKPLRAYTWYCPVRLNQSPKGACVGFSWAQEFASRPKMHTLVTNQLAFDLYDVAQLLDEWADTPPQEGTSVLAGAKASQQVGYLGEYRWCFSLRDLQLTIGYLGPVVLGLWWWTGMMDTDGNGYIHRTGIREGGHAILCTGYSPTLKRFRLVQTWGDEWGINGCCFVHEDDMDFLLHDEGEACVPTLRRFVDSLR